MAIFVMLTRVAHDEVDSPLGLETLENQLMEHIQRECPSVKWIHNYAVLGPYDYIDIFEAPDMKAAVKVATLVRTFGHSDAEIWPATEWGEFKAMLHTMPQTKTGAGRAIPGYR